MSKIKIFLTLTGYQITWLACVFGQNKLNQPLLGIYIGLLYLLIFFYFNKNKIKFLKLSLYISIPGYIFDTFMVYFSIYEFNSSSDSLLGSTSIKASTSSWVILYCSAKFSAVMAMGMPV